MSSRVVVLSDLHLTVEHPWAAFRDHTALAAFLRHLAEQPPLRLVLAGDIFDFLLLPDYDSFDAARAVARLETLLSDARVAEVVDALGVFANRPGHEVALLSGNHDAELALPAVFANTRFNPNEPVVTPDSIFHGGQLIDVEQ